MNALVLIAEGFEEMEMVTIVDILRRGEISVTLATIEKNFLVLGRNGISILSEEKVVDIYEKVIDNQTFYDCIIVPGGMESVKRLSLNSHVLKLLAIQEKQERYICCLCAGILVALEAKVYLGKRITCHPSISEKINKCYIYDENLTTVTDNKMITGAGPATALNFSLAIVEILAGKNVADGLKPKLVYNNNAI